MDKPVCDKDLIQVILGECSPEKRERIGKWIKEKPENRERLRKLRETWRISGSFELQRHEDKAWEKIARTMANPGHLTIHRLGSKDAAEERRSEPHAQAKSKDKSEGEGEGENKNILSAGYVKSKYSHIWLGRIAVAGLLIIGAFYMLHAFGTLGGERGPAGSELKKIAAGRGERVNITLSDGTSVVLNSSSSIRYPSHFNGKRREITLQGEAFFSVARNENKPFRVHTEGAIVRVLGTKFNVNAYADVEGIEVVVEDGEVAVEADSSGGRRDHDLNEVILGQGEYTIVREGAAPTLPVQVPLDRHLGWINGNLIFEAAPLDMVIKKLERYYNRDFIVADSSLRDQKLTVSFKKESLSRVLDVLSIALDVEYEKRDSLIYIKP